MRKFPDNFVWGTATAAMQIEGALRESGAGESSWERFAGKPGAIYDNSTPVNAVEHFKYWKKDIAIMKELGVNAYRFSIPWSRTVPDGRNINPLAMDFYNRLTDELLTNGIEPFVTLFHWETPQALEDRGGWLNKDTAYATEIHAEVVLKNLADRVKNFFTINEAMCFTLLGYGSGVHAPGACLGEKAALQALHNGFLAHGVMLDVIRKTAPHVKAGIVENCITQVPVWESEENCLAARKAFFDRNANRITLVMEGRYTDEFLKKAGNNAPQFTDGELKLIGSKMDHIGINCYSGEYVIYDPDVPMQYRNVPFSDDFPRMMWDWFGFEPSSLYWSIRAMNELWGGNSYYISENGCPAADRPSAENGKVEDVKRIMFLRQYLAAAQRATAENLPLKGYFHWSLMDNFEWAWGFSSRFGLYHVNLANQERTPKLSAGFFRDVIRNNALL